MKIHVFNGGAWLDEEKGPTRINVAGETTETIEEATPENIKKHLHMDHKALHGELNKFRQLQEKRKR